MKSLLKADISLLNNSPISYEYKSLINVDFIKTLMQKECDFKTKL